MRSYFYKEQLENSSKEELQETVNKMIEAGIIPPNTRVIYDKPIDVNKVKKLENMDRTIYMTSESWEALNESLIEDIEDLKDGYFSKEDLMSLALALKAMVHPIDNETMEQIHQFVESKENN